MLCVLRLSNPTRIRPVGISTITWSVPSLDFLFRSAHKKCSMRLRIPTQVNTEGIRLLHSQVLFHLEDSIRKSLSNPTRRQAVARLAGYIRSRVFCSPSLTKTLDPDSLFFLLEKLAPSFESQRE